MFYQILSNPEKKSIRPLIEIALRKDHVQKDITSLAIFGKGGGNARGSFIAKQNLVISGLGVVREILWIVSKKIRFHSKFHNGDFIKRGQVIAYAEGSINDLLSTERVALNFLQQLSGVATLTRQFVRKIKPYRARILDTRKTLPGLRTLQKSAVVHGGGDNHRMGLADMYLIKDNHIKASGCIREAIRRTKRHRSRRRSRAIIEVEAQNIREVEEALEEGVDIILLDNMNLSQIKRAVKLAKGKCLLEVSGGVNIKNVRSVAKTGVSRISIGALTHSAPAVDISFLIE